MSQIDFEPEASAAPKIDFEPTKIDFEPVGPPSPTPEVDKAVAQTKDIRSDPYVQDILNAPSPESGYKPAEHQVAEAAAKAFMNVASGLVPRSVGQAAKMVTPLAGAPEEIGRHIKYFRDVVSGTPLDEAANKAFPERSRFVDAEKTPPFSVERFQAGFQTLADMAMAGGIVHGLTRAPVARPEGESATLTPPEAQTRPIQATGGLETLITQPLETLTQGEPNAQQISETTPVYGDVLDTGRTQESAGEMPTPESGSGVPARGQGDVVEGQAPQEAQPRVTRVVNQQPISGIVGPKLSEDAATKLKGAGVNEELSSDLPDIKYRIRTANNVINVTATQDTGSSFSPVASAHLHIASDGQTTLGGSFIHSPEYGHAPHPNPRLANLAKERLLKFLRDEVKPQELSAPQEDVAVAQPEGGGEPAAAAVSGAETPPAAEPPRSVTSLQNAVTEAERVNRGLGPREAVESQSWDKAKSIAQSEAAADPGKGARLVEELNQQPRALDDVEGVHLLNRKVEVNREFDNALENLRRNPEDVDAIARMTKAREDAYKMYQATEASGTAWGRGGRIRQAMMADDYSMSRMEATRRVANKGKPLSTSQMMEVADHYSKISKQEARIRVAEDSLQTPSGRMRPQEILNAVEQMKRRLTPCL